MKKTTKAFKKRICIAITAVLLLLTVGLVVSAYDISPAINVLRNNKTFTKYALKGTEATFAKAEFFDVAGCEFDYITITEIPNKEAGILKISGVDVLEGQSITAESLDLLKFVPTSKNTNESPEFAFTISEEKWKGTEITCSINYLSSVNYAPIANNFYINTVKNISVYSEITVYDPDNDKVTVKIGAYPSFGTVEINNTLNRVSYNPEKDFTGSDVFTIYAEDSYGNRSGEATVYVNVDSDADKMTFGDMADNSIHYAALALSKNNIMTYSKKGGEYYFSPDEEVNKIDFTVMLLCASRLNSGIGAVKDTEFIDDTKLSSGRKSYLKRALDTEIIEIGDRYFKPDDIITVKEAQDMVAKALGLESESEAVKAIMGTSADGEKLTKENVAEILYNICLYLN